VTGQDWSVGTVEVSADLYRLLRSDAGKIVLAIEEADRGHGSLCWIADYHLNDGYAVVRIDGRMQKAHRVVYERVIGAIPSGRVLDHLCGVRQCCNPRHLEPVTRRENTLRGNGVTARNARAEECVNGHALTGNNVRTRCEGFRTCIPCERNRTAKKRGRVA
jgi:HNH endonuclease